MAGRPRPLGSLDGGGTRGVEEEQPTLLLLDTILNNIQKTNDSQRSGRPLRGRRQRSEDDGGSSSLASASHHSVNSERGLAAHGGSAHRKSEEEPTSSSSSSVDIVPRSFQRRAKKVDRPGKLLPLAGEHVVSSPRTSQSPTEEAVGARAKEPPPTKGVPPGAVDNLALAVKSDGGRVSEDEDSEEAAQFDPPDDDRSALSWLSEVQAEVLEWTQQDGAAEQPQHRRDAFASYINAKFLCQRLDSLKKSTVVTSVRRKVSRCVEDIAGGRRPALGPPVRATTALASKAAAVLPAGNEHRWNRSAPEKSVSERMKVAPNLVATSKGHGKKTHWCTVKDGDWICRICSKLNYEEDDKCSTCGRAQISPSAAEPTEKPVPKHVGHGKDDKHAFTEEERTTNAQLERVQHEYKAFVQTKLRLDK